MKVIFKTEDPIEQKRILKADDMADFIFELKHNAWRQFKHTGYDYGRAWEVINLLLEEFEINVNELTE